MDVTAGTRLGPYEIVAPLGAGGMGQVYRARDTRLKRDVALKVISERIQDRPDLRERFQREATAVAALNHPNICQVYDVGAEHGVDFMVMELVDGETLSARLSRGRLPIAEAMRVARELTAAVGAAHRAGVVHRDIKPSNIMLTRSGVKLLDFGLARQRQTPAIADTNSTQAPLTDPLTLTGMVLGTWQYMSPEQLRGGEADARSDVFSIGVVLYEAFTGKRLFQRPTHEGSLIAILEEEPAPMMTVRPDVPVNIDRMVRVCLAKDPADRWQAAGDVHHALEAATDVSLASPRAANIRSAAMVAAAVLMAAVIVATAWPRGTATGDRHPLMRSTIDVGPTEIREASGDAQFLPDGNAFIFSGTSGGRNQLFRHDLITGETTAIPGTEGGVGPFLSPDGTWIGFAASSWLMKVPVTGGPAVRIAEQLTTNGASWGDDGFIVYAGPPESGLLRVSASGGPPTVISTLTPEDAGNDHCYPEVLPGGRHVLFSVGTGPEPSARIAALDLATGRRKDVVHGAFSFRYAHPGHIAYVSNDAMFVVPFDAGRLEVTGPPTKIAEGVQNFDGVPEFAISKRGDLIYVPGSSAGPQRRVAFVSMAGAVEAPPALVGPFAGPRFSPDGTKLALLRYGPKNNTWVYDLERTTLTRNTYGRYQFPIWTRDGRITVPKGGPGNQRILIRDADGTGEDGPPLTGGGSDERPTDWTPDGGTLIYDRRHAMQVWDIWSVTPGRHQPAPLVTSPYNEQNGRISPDGRLLVYASNDSGMNQVYVSRLSGERQRVQVSAHGAVYAVWSPDGRRVYFRGPIGDQSPGVAVWSSEITTAPRLSATKPRLQFRNDGFTGAFDMSPDGQRFVMVADDTRRSVDTFRMVHNWQGLLSRDTRE